MPNIRLKLWITQYCVKPAKQADIASNALPI